MLKVKSKEIITIKNKKQHNIIIYIFLLSPGEALNELECTYRLAISYFYA